MYSTTTYHILFCSPNNNFILGKIKFAAKSLKCLFLGFVCLHKGYWWYFPNLRWYIVSANVIFFETCCFYPSTPEDPNNYCQSQSLSLEVITFPVTPKHVFFLATIIIPMPSLCTNRWRKHPPPITKDSCNTLTLSQPSHPTYELSISLYNGNMLISKS